MPEYLLYYAGCDKIHEQVGLAVSRDGVHFERHGGDGLIVPVEPTQAWRALRTCNPTVLQVEGRYVMWYQGIAYDGPHTSIARAVSADGREWQADPEPCLPWQRMQRYDRGQDPAYRAAVFEPALLHEHGRFRMWFLYMHPTHASNSLFYAESADGVEWDVEPRPLLSGNRFGFCLLHYPQVLPVDGGYELLFTLRSRRTFVDAIYRATSPDGLAWGEPSVVLRRPGRMVRSRWNVPGKVANRLARPLVDLVDTRISKGVNVLGYSHAHVLRDRTPELLYYHNDHHGRRGRWLDISRRERAGGGWGAAVKVLEPSPAERAWDGFFVADPYVVVA